MSKTLYHHHMMGPLMEKIQKHIASLTALDIAYLYTSSREKSVDFARLFVNEYFKLSVDVVMQSFLIDLISEIYHTQYKKQITSLVKDFIDRADTKTSPQPISPSFPL